MKDWMAMKDFGTFGLLICIGGIAMCLERSGGI
jgi:hypothetical protein